MLRRGRALLSVLVLPLAAASAPGDFGSLQEFARAVGMKQGAWRTRITVTAADFRPSPKADPAVLARSRARIESLLGKVQERNACLDPESGDGLRLPGIVIDPVCSFSRMHAKGGRWTLDTRCSIPANDETAELRGEGTYSRTAVSGTHEGETTLKGVVVHVKAQFESRHVGECSAPRPSDRQLEED
ncbi:MAG TPA: DUF3617 family protein [Allosphingosinicella sp.]|nr:DUF3617 family protein [Allosphingosinicella sp.]